MLAVMIDPYKLEDTIHTMRVKDVNVYRCFNVVFPNFNTPVCSFVRQLLTINEFNQYNPTPIVYTVCPL